MRRRTQNAYKKTKKKFKSAFNKIVKEEEKGSLVDEAAFPSYAHQNPLIDYIFWKRLRTVASRLDTKEKMRVLDFGCGGGVMTYLLANMGHTAIGFDPEYGPLEKVKQHITFPEDVHFITEKELEESNIKYDVIVALDVLEHVNDLDKIISDFKQRLTPDGKIIVSGPTENIFYQIGRFFAGDKFSGEYHTSDIYTIRDAFSERAQVKTINRIPLFPPLFLVFEARFIDF